MQLESGAFLLNNLAVLYEYTFLYIFLFKIVLLRNDIHILSCS